MLNKVAVNVNKGDLVLSRWRPGRLSEKVTFKLKLEGRRNETYREEEFEAARWQWLSQGGTLVDESMEVDQ
jgi:hypothetical protein